MTGARRDGWQRPGAWRAWRAAGAFETDWRQRWWVARRLVAPRYGDPTPVLLDLDVTGADAGHYYSADAYHAHWAEHDPAEAPTVAPEAATVPRPPGLGQRALGCLATVAAVALATAVLVALVVPEVRGTVAWYATAGVVLTVAAVILARRRKWARRARHRRQRATAARRASRARAARQQANRDRHATVVGRRADAAASAREQRRAANRERHWRQRGGPPPSPADPGDGGAAPSRIGEQGRGGERAGA